MTSEYQYTRICSVILWCEWNAQVVDGMEADDAIAIKATELDHNAIICSLDKDFKQVPCSMYDYTKKVLTAVKKDDAMRWLYKQALMGDRVDNIPGIYGVGPKKADKIIDPCTTEWECYSTCLTNYLDHELDEDRLLEILNLLLSYVHLMIGMKNQVKYDSKFEKEVHEIMQGCEYHPEERYVLSCS